MKDYKKNKYMEDYKKYTYMILLIVLSLSVILLSACQNTTRINIGNQNENTTLSNEKYCERDTDCVRQKSCCDCGLGNYVNKKYYSQTECATQCMCATVDSIGKCIDNECTGQARE